MLLYVGNLAGGVHYCKTMLETAPYLLWLFGKVLNRMEDGDGMEDLENQPLLNDWAGRIMQTRNISIGQLYVMVNGQAVPVHQSQFRFMVNSIQQLECSVDSYTTSSSSPCRQ